MMITLLIYTIVFSIIIFKGFYKNIPLMEFFSVRKNTESLVTYIQIESLPFYLNIGKINLFSLFINFFLISLISSILIPDLISNHIAYCQEESSSVLIESHLYSDNGGPFEKETKLYIKSDKYQNCNLKKWGQVIDKNIFNNSYKGLLEKYINKTYKISNQKNPFIFHLNYSGIKIYESLEMRVFEGLAEDFDNILKNQEKLIQKINNIDEKTYRIKKVKNMYEEIYLKNNNMLYLISKAYNKSIINNFNNILTDYYYSNKVLSEISNEKMDNEDINKIIREFIGNDHFLNKKATNIFISLEKIKCISKKNCALLDEISRENPRIKITSNTNLIEEVYLSDKLQVKINSNLNDYCNKNINILKRKGDIIFSQSKIDSFYEKFSKGSYFKNNKDILTVSSIEDMGFSFEIASKNTWYNDPWVSHNRIVCNNDYGTDNEETRRQLRAEEASWSDSDFDNLRDD